MDNLDLKLMVGILPLAVSENGDLDEPLTEVVICSSISGGADYENEMPRELTLVRLTAEGEEYTARYQQVVMNPT